MSETKTESRALWERQEWDTEASFTRFQAYYLSQIPPRNLTQAYREYLMAECQMDAQQVQSVTQAGGTWNRWYYGQDTNGGRFPTWAERAAAYDDHVWAERREWLKRERWELAERGLQQVRDMLDYPLVTQRREEDENGRIVAYITEPAKWTKKDAATLYQTFDKSTRLDTGEVTDRTAVTGPGAVDYSTYSDDRINDEINRFLARHGTAGARNLVSPTFREGEETTGSDESQPESSQRDGNDNA